MQIFSRAENESIFGALKCFFESQRARENIKKNRPKQKKMLLICFHRNNALEKGFYCRKKKIFLRFFLVLN